MPGIRSGALAAATVFAVAVLAVLAGLAGCGAASLGPAAHGASGSAQTPGPRVITVLAASSAAGPVGELAKKFEASHPGTTVRVSAGSSTTLVQQAAAGAPADLLVLAGDASLSGLPGALSARRKVTVATNVLEIATPASNPAQVARLADLASPAVKVVACVASAPCGAAADAAFTKAGVTPHLVSRELDARATLAKLQLGEVDVAIVYHSDVVSAGAAVHGIPNPPEHNVSLAYPLVQLTEAPGAAELFVALSAAEARPVWSRAGFGMP